MFELSRKPQSIEKVIANGLTLYASVIKRLVPLSFLYALAVILPNILLHIELPKTLEALNTAVIFYVVILFACNVFAIWLIAVIFHQTYQLMIQKKVGYANSMLVAFYRLPLFLIAGFIFMFLCIVGGVLFIYPGVYLYFLLMFYFIYILIEHRTIGESFELSAELVWSHWWRTFAVLLPLILAVAVVVLLSELFFDLPLIHLSRFHQEEMSVATHAVTIVLITLINPWFATTLLCQFHDLKLRKKK